MGSEKVAYWSGFIEESEIQLYTELLLKLPLILITIIYNTFA